MMPFTKKMNTASRLPSLISLAAFLVLSGCKSRPVSPPAQADGSLVVARYGDKTITDKDLMARISEIETQYPVKNSTHPQKLALLNELINLELMYQEALRTGLEKDFVFKAKLADAYLTRQSQEALKTITAAEVQKYYQAHQKEIDQVSARHILIKVDRKDSSAVKAEKRKKMETLLAKARAEPSSFQDLARLNSEDSSAENGGELGFFAYPQMVEPFSKAAFALKKVGDISPLVESQFGFHIIQLTGEKRELRFFESAIRDALVRSTQRDRFDRDIARLRQAANVEIFESNLQSLSPLPSVVDTDPKTLVPEDFSPLPKKSPEPAKPAPTKPAKK